MAKEIKNLNDVSFTNKTVIVRANLDVPVKNGEVQDNTKIKLLLPTIQHLLKNNCKIIVLAHLGERTGKYDDAFSLMPVRFELGRLLQKPIKFVGIATCSNSIKFMEFGEILMLENLFFSKEEFASSAKVKNDFVKTVASFADYFVNEAFGVDPKLASMQELPKMLKVVYGLNYIKELESIDKLKKGAPKPFVGIVGGNNLSDKLGLIKMLSKKADYLLIGGAIAYDFLSYKKIPVGKSNISKTPKAAIKEIFDNAKKSGCEIILPVDHIAAKEFSEDAKPVTVKDQGVPSDLIGMDIGPKTQKLFEGYIEKGKTILWSGTMGVFEWANFYKGTESVGENVSLLAPKDSYKIAVGNDTLLAISKLKLKHKKFSHISAGAEYFLKEIS